VECYSQIISSDRRSLEVEGSRQRQNIFHGIHTISDVEEICTKQVSRVIILNSQSSAKGEIWLALVLNYSSTYTVASYITSLALV